jgi:outer membrane protein OmpA-like peptidoglycan-associated protein
MPPDELERVVGESREEPLDEALTSPGVPAPAPEFPAQVSLEDHEGDPPLRRWVWALVGFGVVVAVVGGVIASRSAATRARPKLADAPRAVAPPSASPVTPAAPPTVDAGSSVEASPAAAAAVSPIPSPEAPAPVEVQPEPAQPAAVPQDRVVATPPEEAKPVAFEWTLPGRYQMGEARPRKSRGLSASMLRKVVNKALKQCGGQLVITGHSCTIGTEAARKRIGLERAQAMAQRLVRLGVRRSALHVVSMGAASPVASNETIAGRARNRRVTLSCPE